MVVGRFAPSPSGRMHLGNVFAALLAWVSARAAGGEFVLRIEDLDPERSHAEYADAIRDDLRWLGLQWDREMPLQSTRTPVYAEYFARLQAKGLLYPCFCTRSELHAASAPHASDGSLLYAGICRGLTDAQIRAQNRPPAWRIRVPEECVACRDGVYGEVSQNLQRECGDFILRRSDGVYAYQLAVVCDDALGGITQVVRGRDLLSSTPRQIWLCRMLGFEPPEYYHVPLLIAPDGRRLSKRERDLDLSRLRERFRPEALIGRLAFLSGLVPLQEPISAAELAQEFAWEKLSRKDIPIPPDF